MEQYAGHARSPLLRRQFKYGAQNNHATTDISPFCDVWVGGCLYVSFFLFLFRSTDRIELPINERTRHSRAPPAPP